MNFLPRFIATILCCLLLPGCNTADKHYWNWRNGFDREFSFSYIAVDPTLSGDSDEIDPNDFDGPGLDAYSIADDPGVFYRSLAITAGTQITLVVFPPGAEFGIVIARSEAGGDAGVFSSYNSTTTAIQMFWIETIDWADMARQYGHGTYKVCWYWDDEKIDAAAQHTFELTP